MDKICTVLLISYNHAPYIEKCIESVLSQKTKYPYIIKIFDDCSTDGTQEIIREYANKYPDLIEVHISETNLGAQTNIWRAYKSVDTKYCIYTETDDYWCDDNKLEIQITALEEHPNCSFCSHNTVQINQGDKVRKNFIGRIQVTNKVLNRRNSEVNLKQIKAYPFGYMPHINSRVIRTSAFNLDKIKHKEAFLYDNCQFYYLLTKGNMYYIPKVMSAYVLTGNGIFSGNEDVYRRIRKHMEAFFELEDEIISSEKE